MENSVWREDPLVKRAQAVFPAFEPVALISDNGKALVIKGLLEGQAVVIKILKASDPILRQLFDRELSVLEAFLREAPPFSTPKVLAVDGKDNLAVLQYLPGDVLSAERFPVAAPEPGIFEQVLRILLAVSGYSHALNDSAERLSRRYLDRWQQYLDGGILNESDLALLKAFLGSHNSKPVFQHGDPCGVNFLCDQGRLWILDWELASGYLPFYDLATLWVFCVRQATLQEKIEQVIQDQSGGESYLLHSFWLNALITTAREFRISSTKPEPDTVVPLLQQALAQVRDRLR